MANFDQILIRGGSALQNTSVKVTKGKLRHERFGWKEWVSTGADEQELATPILSLCHGIFTD